MANWSKIRSRGQVDDRRGRAGYADLPILGGSVSGVGFVAVAIIIILSMTGSNTSVVDVLETLNSVQQNSQSTIGAEAFEGEDEYETFAATVLGSNNDVWRGVLASSDTIYTEPKLVLFRGVTNSGCGGASAQVGPHYCPLDRTIYLDETFFDTLQKRFGAQGGDVAEAYVIAHEVGHHVQNELGISDQVLAAKQSGNPEANELSIKLELQADCMAGIWAHSIRDLGVFGPNEIQEAMDAAAAVGDDRIQTTTTGRVSPENWTHGSSAQRVQWFTQGYNSGNPAICDTFLN